LAVLTEGGFVHGYFWVVLYWLRAGSFMVLSGCIVFRGLSASLALTRFKGVCSGDKPAGRVWYRTRSRHHQRFEAVKHAGVVFSQFCARSNATYLPTGLPLSITISTSLSDCRSDLGCSGSQVPAVRLQWLTRTVYNAVQDTLQAVQARSSSSYGPELAATRPRLGYQPYGLHTTVAFSTTLYVSSGTACCLLPSSVAIAIA